MALWWSKQTDKYLLFVYLVVEAPVQHRKLQYFYFEILFEQIAISDHGLKSIKLKEDQVGLTLSK